MSGGRQYWNEDTQRWEESGATGSVPATPPPDPTPPTRTPLTPPAAPPPRVPPTVPPAYRRTAPDGVPAGGTDENPDAGPGTGGEGFWESLHRPPDEGPSTAGDGWSGGSDGARSDSAWSTPEQAAPGGTSAPDDGPDRPYAGPGQGHGDAPYPYPYPSPSQWSTVPQDTGSSLGGAPPRGTVPPGRAGRRLMWSVVAGVAVVAVAVCLALFRTGGLGGGDGDDKDVGASGKVSPSTQDGSLTGTSPASPSGTRPSSSPSPSGIPVPPGYETYDDEQGFRIVIPSGWSRSTRASAYGMRVVNYRSADSTHRIQLYQVAEPSPDESFTLFLSDATAKPAGFRELSLTNLDEGDFTGSRLTYLADSIRGEPDVGKWHVVDERFVGGDGLVYAIAVYGPQTGETDDQLTILTTALQSFCPSGAPCSALDTD